MNSITPDEHNPAISYIQVNDTITTTIDTDVITRLVTDCTHCYFAAPYVYVGLRKGNRTTLHRFVNQTTDGMTTDHIDQDKLNNCRRNLRSVTHAQNSQNRKRYANRTGYIGVFCTSGTKNRYSAQIELHRKIYYLGSFGSAREAALARDIGKRRYHPSAPINTNTYNFPEFFQ